ncbi:MAG: triose-phosphate isomerase [bacterium]
MRTPFVAGNWKMHLTAQPARELAEGIARASESIQGVDVALCPPFPLLTPVQNALGGTKVALGAQNLFWEIKGAFTGEVSAEMLLDAGCRFVIVGHSERRQYFGETDSSVNRRAHTALSAGLIPIICVGETLDEREGEMTIDVINRQVRGALERFTPEQAANLVVAYEPVWAIGTGRTATPEMAQEVHAQIRSLLTELFGKDIAQAIRILYGGSVKPDNAVELFAKQDIDGGLVGGASLKVDDFSAIIAAAQPEA